MPDIDALIWKKYQGQGVLVYGLHSGERPDLLQDFVEQTGVSYPIVDGRRTLSRFEFPPGVNYPYPRDVVIDKRGVVRSIKNSFDVNEMDALIEQLLAE